MTGSFSSTWMLPLLLPLFITSIHSTTFFHHEFDVDLKAFNQSVKGCWDCSSTRTECKCFNYNISAVDCGFPGFFIEGLKKLNSSNPDKETVGYLIHELKITEIKDPALNNTSFCSQSAHPAISPACLHKKLDHVKSYINDKYTNNKESLSSPYVPVNC